MKLLMTQGGSPWECVVMREVWGGLSFFYSLGVVWTRREWSLLWGLD